MITTIDFRTVYGFYVIVTNKEKMQRQNFFTLSYSFFVEEFGLNQNYPNPFNPATTIGYQIPETSERCFTTIRIFNLLGQEVVTLVNDEKDPEKHSVRWNTAGMSGGVYYCLMTAQDHSGHQAFRLVKKLLLL